MPDVLAIRRAGAALRRLRLARRGVLVAALALALGATIAVPPRPRLVWNASASAPLGLYAVAAPASIRAGDTVIAWAPAPYRRLAAARHYLPANVPLVKRVAAVAGDTVCARGAAIHVDGHRVATRRPRDGMGRAMPWWTRCETLRDGELLLLAGSGERSFDGRYFGPSGVEDVVGIAWPLWLA